MYADGKLTSDVLGTEIAKTMQDRLEYLQDSTLIKILAQDMYGDEVYDTQTGELEYSLTLQNIESSFSDKQDITQSANLLSALIHRDGLSVLENFNIDTLNDTEFKDALALNAVTYSVDAEGNVSGSYKGIIEGTSQNDSISSGGEVYGHDGDDTLTGSSGHDYITSNAGDDTNHDVRIELSNMSHKYTSLLYNNFFKQNTHTFITKQDNINNYLKILNSFNFNKIEVA